MYYFIDEFSMNIDSVINGDTVDTVLTLKHDPTGNEKSIVIPAAEFIGQNWNSVFFAYQGKLLDELGYVAPPHYPADEFGINYYYLGKERGSAWNIEHRPSGMCTSAVEMTKSGPPASFHIAMQEQQMAELVKQLAQAGVMPQPPKIARKKAGKPRHAKLKEEENRNDV